MDCQGEESLVSDRQTFEVFPAYFSSFFCQLGTAFFRRLGGMHKYIQKPEGTQESKQIIDDVCSTKRK